MIMQRGLAKSQFKHNQFLVKQKLLMCKILWAIINPHDGKWYNLNDRIHL